MTLKREIHESFDLTIFTGLSVHPSMKIMKSNSSVCPVNISKIVDYTVKIAVSIKMSWGVLFCVIRLAVVYHGLQLMSFVILLAWKKRKELFELRERRLVVNAVSLTDVDSSIL